MTLFGYQFEPRDGFAALSILVAAIGIIANQVYDRRKRRQAARAQALESALRQLQLNLRGLLDIQNRQNWRVEGSAPSDQHIVNAVMRVDVTLNLLENGPFSVWGTRAQRRTLRRLKDGTYPWFIRFLSSRELDDSSPAKAASDEFKKHVREEALKNRKLSDLEKQAKLSEPIGAPDIEELIATIRNGIGEISRSLRF